MRPLQRTLPAPADLAVGVVGVPAGSELHLQLRLESVVEGVLVTGTAQVQLAGECARCLQPITGEQQVELQELFFYPDQSTDETDAARLHGDLLDLEPLLRDAVVLALPFTPLCSADCPGLCPTCGERLADHADHLHEQDDPRWAALRVLTDQGISASAGPAEQEES
jgi:uncharacterized protein